MRTGRVARWVARWVRLYTTGLSRPVARRRIAEIQADLHDQIIHERSLGVSDRVIALRIASRAVRGVAADVAWRGHEVRVARTHSINEHTMETCTLAGSVVRVSAFVFAVLAIPLVGMAVSAEVEWSVTDFALAGTLLGVIGICIDAAIRRRGNMLIASAVAGLGVAAAIVGELDDAPGLVLLGVMMIAGGCAVAHRRIQSTH